MIGLSLALYGAVHLVPGLAWAARQTPPPTPSSPPPPQTQAPAPKAEVPKGPRAIIKTKHGEIEIKFYPELAPKHVENFIKLAKEGFYDGTIFHRVIPGFMIQGGDPYTKETRKKEEYGTGGPGYTIKAEFSDTPHKRGIVSMARAGDPDTAGSQFFIVVEDSRFLDRKYTVFGEVVRGIGVADKIVNEPRDAKDNPLNRIEMTVKIVE
ncbi:MAG: peptidylprolyl isomerase [Nitrospirota bacterium]|nr:peptidylprolyl isomerase [Nitrospirota bacterium]MDE3226306.1 peptidylprolyl isomerase [Nitrospirota bacterium]MDE3242575.1 peptidylprolyl isomerase [Nitrospirota bacterium]